MAMAMGMVETLIGLFLLMFALLLLLFILVCKPWRFFFSSSSSSNRSIKADDIEEPLFSNDLNLGPSQSNDFAGSHVLVGPSVQGEGNFCSPRTHGLFNKQRLLAADVHVSQGPSLVLDIISDLSEDLLVGHTLKRPSVAGWPVEDRNFFRKEEPNNSASVFDDDGYRVSVPKSIADQRSSLTLEVISGPSCGLRCFLQSANTARLPLTLGRVPPSDLLLKDSEVSGKHALINWNLNKLKWELVDMGSLNGTLLNSQAIHQPDSSHRHWSEPIELASGDIITLGTTSKVQITSHAEHHIPFGVGVASDPMAMRRGGKKLPMEDVCYYQWPLPGVEQFGVFGIFDGHGGAGAANAASKMLPKFVAKTLSVSERRDRVLTFRDASEVLRDAFSQTEAFMNHQYEGCTATVLLVWADHHEDFFAQCANLGDSACVINVGEKQINMTEDHRITSQPEKTRLRKTGPPLKDGETRLCGLNIARMLGDKFLKEQDPRFTSEPYVSQVVHIPKASKAFALLASDGLWDVIGIKRAVQLVLQARENYNVDKENSAESVANFLLSEARTLRTKDNTSIIFLDFNTTRTAPCNIDS
ncbi:kinase associated protein phosphatase isoform X2 [Tasmannia lanceolata]|uniref:kinase associated protein phosphatase isoform X2 n=1 Tax=Tasmannia lanceolata TaxID=3420 RepID=UPI0040628448